VVAVDGSDVAVQAFNYAARLLKKRDKNDKSKNDKLVIYHVTNPERYPDMSANFRPDVIKAAYETYAIKADINYGFDIQFKIENKTADKKIREMIRDFAEENADIIVLGAFGYKRVQRDDFASIGSTTATVTAGCKAVAIVIGRDTKPLPLRRQRRFLAAVDGSDLAHCAVWEALKHMLKGDYMQIVHVEGENDVGGQTIVERYDKWLIENKIKGACKSIKKPPEVSIANELLDAAETGDECSEFGATHIIVIGSHGLSRSLPAPTAENYREYQLASRSTTTKGSVAEEILANAKHCAVMTVTVDSLLSGAVKSVSFQDWYDGNQTQ